eukprot:CAMPEP_0197522370 /NCGR_PEP_ID=MMETSP1318-20131121/7537_1 /TAXON_ID=552666 /ORGANISM="Partenskyella glossopodia, Strain RCC365" /LENGTH=296 /DNA_ID=CAMNT_0043074745 /DNA_START=159 /DNA_END=1049 /DNA_ORIENTATION=+
MELLSSARPLIAYTGEFLVNQGDQIQHIFVIRKGAVSMVFSQYPETMLNSLRDYDFFGHEFIFTTGRAMCNFMCMTDVTAVTIERKVFLQILSRHVGRYLDIKGMAEERLLDLSKQLKAYRHRNRPPSVIRENSRSRSCSINLLHGEMKKLSIRADSYCSADAEDTDESPIPLCGGAGMHHTVHIARSRSRSFDAPVAQPASVAQVAAVPAAVPLPPVSVSVSGMHRRDRDPDASSVGLREQMASMCRLLVSLREEVSALSSGSRRQRRREEEQLVVDDDDRAIMCTSHLRLSTKE